MGQNCNDLKAILRIRAIIIFIYLLGFNKKKQIILSNNLCFIVGSIITTSFSNYLIYKRLKKSIKIFVQ